MSCEVTQAIGQGFDVRHLRVGRILLFEHFAEQTCEPAIILDQQNSLDRRVAHPGWLCCGNMTLVSQKSLMLRTSASNASSVTGFRR